jgi:hypothetical protein
VAQEFPQRRNNNCVEVVGSLPRVVAVRDSKHPDGPVLVVTREEWRAFTAGFEGRPVRPTVGTTPSG